MDSVTYNKKGNEVVIAKRRGTPKVNFFSSAQNARLLSNVLAERPVFSGVLRWIDRPENVINALPKETSIILDFSGVKKFSSNDIATILLIVKIAVKNNQIITVRSLDDSLMSTLASLHIFKLDTVRVSG